MYICLNIILLITCVDNNTQFMILASRLRSGCLCCYCRRHRHLGNKQDLQVMTIFFPRGLHSLTKIRPCFFHSRRDSSDSMFFIWKRSRRIKTCITYSEESILSITSQNCKIRRQSHTGHIFSSCLTCIFQNKISSLIFRV